MPVDNNGAMTKAAPILSGALPLPIGLPEQDVLPAQAATHPTLFSLARPDLALEALVQPQSPSPVPEIKFPIRDFIPGIRPALLDTAGSIFRIRKGERDYLTRLSFLLNAASLGKIDDRFFDTHNSGDGAWKEFLGLPEIKPLFKAMLVELFLSAQNSAAWLEQLKAGLKQDVALFESLVGEAYCRTDKGAELLQLARQGKQRLQLDHALSELGMTLHYGHHMPVIKWGSLAVTLTNRGEPPGVASLPEPLTALQLLAKHPPSPLLVLSPLIFSDGLAAHFEEAAPETEPWFKDLVLGESLDDFHQAMALILAQVAVWKKDEALVAALHDLTLQACAAREAGLRHLLGTVIPPNILTASHAARVDVRAAMQQDLRSLKPLSVDEIVFWLSEQFSPTPRQVLSLWLRPQLALSFIMAPPLRQLPALPDSLHPVARLMLYELRLRLKRDPHLADLQNDLGLMTLKSRRHPDATITALGLEKCYRQYCPWGDLILDEFRRRGGTLEAPVKKQIPQTVDLPKPVRAPLFSLKQRYDQQKTDLQNLESALKIALAEGLTVIRAVEILEAAKNNADFAQLLLREGRKSDFFQTVSLPEVAVSIKSVKPKTTSPSEPVVADSPMPRSDAITPPAQPAVAAAEAEKKGNSPDKNDFWASLIRNGRPDKDHPLRQLLMQMIRFYSAIQARASSPAEEPSSVSVQYRALSSPEVFKQAVQQLVRAATGQLNGFRSQDVEALMQRVDDDHDTELGLSLLYLMHPAISGLIPGERALTLRQATRFYEVTSRDGCVIWGDILKHGINPNAGARAEIEALRFFAAQSSAVYLIPVDIYEGKSVCDLLTVEASGRVSLVEVKSIIMTLDEQQNRHEITKKIHEAARQLALQGRDLQVNHRVIYVVIRSHSATTLKWAENVIGDELKFHSELKHVSAAFVQGAGYDGKIVTRGAKRIFSRHHDQPGPKNPEFVKQAQALAHRLIDDKFFNPNDLPCLIPHLLTQQPETLTRSLVALQTGKNTLDTVRALHFPTFAARNPTPPAMRVPPAYRQGLR